MSCNRVLRPYNYTITQGTEITFILPNFVPLDGEIYTLCDCSYVKEATGAEFVYLNIDGTSYNVYACGGNWLQYGRLLNKKAPNRIRMVYGEIPADRQHFEVIHALPCEILRTGITPEA